jgi:GlpG protein
VILLGVIHNPRLAQGFVDYLKSIRIACTLKPVSSHQSAIYVNESQLTQAQDEFRSFEQNPNQPKYYEASWQVGSTTSGLNYSGQSLNLVTRFISLPLLIQLVSLLSVGVYTGFVFGLFQPLFFVFQFNPNQVYTWLTPTIMHFSAMHLIFNLMWWMYLGAKIADQLAIRYLVWVFFVTALCSNWAQYLIVDANFGGLSGVVYGLIGFCWLYGYCKPSSKLSLTQSTLGFMLIWLALGFADVLFVSMANWAHLFGLLSGAALGFVSAKIANASNIKP